MAYPYNSNENPKFDKLKQMWDQNELRYKETKEMLEKLFSDTRTEINESNKIIKANAIWIYSLEKIDNSELMYILATTTTEIPGDGNWTTKRNSRAFTIINEVLLFPDNSPFTSTYSMKELKQGLLVENILNDLLAGNVPSIYRFQ